MGLTFYYKRHLDRNRIHLKLLKSWKTVPIQTLCRRKLLYVLLDVGPDNEGNEDLNRALQEDFVLKQVVNIWEGPKYTAYCSLIDLYDRSRTSTGRRRVLHPSR